MVSKVVLLSILTSTNEGRFYSPVRAFARIEEAEHFQAQNTARAVFEAELTTRDALDNAKLLDERWFMAEVPFVP
jgi:hypothetical protein